MTFKAVLSKIFAKFVAHKIRKWSAHPTKTQAKAFSDLMKGGRDTAFGRDHNFQSINSYEDFKKQIPIRDYEDFIPYIDRIKKGEKNVLWKGKPLYFSKTSGTTSGVKYIPISKESISNHINAARNAILMYIAETGKTDFVNGKMIFLSGSPELGETAGIPTGRLSGIVNHHVPKYLRKNQMPSYKTNCIDDWEIKVSAIVEETFDKNMTLISGIPPWVQMYFDKLIEKTGRPIKDIFPDFSLFIYGGVNYESYRNKIEGTIGKKIDSIELYPASEGFIAFQDSQQEPGLLLILNDGIFYEFIPASEYFNENRTRISLKDVELDVNYAIILSTNAGLWGYSIGDTVKFVSLNPYRIIVTGRIKHFISAFGEHVIAEEVEKALLKAAQEEKVAIVEFTVAPQVNPTRGELPFHEWFIEFASMPTDIGAFRLKVDHSMRELNIYYKDLLDGNILQPLKINVMQKDSFINYMRSQGKLGGQNKMPRLSNDRKIADELKKFVDSPL